MNRNLFYFSLMALILPLGFLPSLSRANAQVQPAPASSLQQENEILWNRENTQDRLERLWEIKQTIEEDDGQPLSVDHGIHIGESTTAIATFAVILLAIFTLILWRRKRLRLALSAIAIISLSLLGIFIASQGTTVDSTYKFGQNVKINPGETFKFTDGQGNNVILGLGTLEYSSCIKKSTWSELLIDNCKQENTQGVDLSGGSYSSGSLIYIPTDPGLKANLFLYTQGGKNTIPLAGLDPISKTNFVIQPQLGSSKESLLISVHDMTSSCAISIQSERDMLSPEKCWEEWLVKNNFSAEVCESARYKEHQEVCELVLRNSQN